MMPDETWGDNYLFHTSYSQVAPCYTIPVLNDELHGYYVHTPCSWNDSHKGDLYENIEHGSGCQDNRGMYKSQLQGQEAFNPYNE